MSGITSEQIMEVADALTQLREVAEGLRAQMLANDWSPTAAEQAGLMVMQSVLLGGVKK